MTDEWIMKTLYIYTMDYNATARKDEIFAICCDLVEPEYMLNEVFQKKKDKH